MYVLIHNPKHVTRFSYTERIKNKKIEVPSLLRALLTAAPGTTKYLVYVHSPVGKISKYECSDVWCHNLELTGPLEPTDQHEYSNTPELYISFVKKCLFTCQGGFHTPERSNDRAVVVRPWPDRFSKKVDTRETAKMMFLQGGRGKVL